MERAAPRLGSVGNTYMAGSRHIGVVRATEKVIVRMTEPWLQVVCYRNIDQLMYYSPKNT